MNPDLTDILNAWPFEPGKINARMIRAEDGRPMIQVRLDLGILQMQTEGRPDGQRPFGYASLLEYYEAKKDDVLDIDAPAPGDRGAARADSDAGGEAEETGAAEGDTERGDAAEPEEDDELTLSPDECRALREEAVQFYHRYLAEMALEDFEAVVRDTTRNLRVLDLCREHAEAEDDKQALEQFRPYITMMRARALAGQMLRDNEPKAAVFALEDALDSLKKHFAEHDQSQLFEQSNEVQMLRSMRDALVPKLPVSQKSELRTRLQRAIEQENYELAAILRDELKMLKE